MFDIIFKYPFRWLVAYFIFASHGFLFAQHDGSFRSFNLLLGGGYGHYFNTFTNVLDKDVKNNRPVFYSKFLWHPEHRLGIGIESGYYFFYSTTRIQTNSGSEKLTSNLKVVPIFLSLSMKIIDHLDLNFATGWASMIYSININNSKKNKIVGHTYSMSNYGAGLTYRRSLNPKIELGAEGKYLYLGKTDDRHLSVFLFLSYKIFNWKVK